MPGYKVVLQNSSGALITHSCSCESKYDAAKSAEESINKDPKTRDDDYAIIENKIDNGDNDKMNYVNTVTLEEELKIDLGENKNGNK